MTYYDLLFKKKVRPEYSASIEKSLTHRNSEVRARTQEKSAEELLEFDFEMVRKAETPLSVAC